jgi:hypothetical protein
MKEYYDILMLFDNDDRVSKLKLLHFNRGKYSEKDIENMEKKGLIRNTGTNIYNEPVYVITDIGLNYRNN